MYKDKKLYNLQNTEINALVLVLSVQFPYYLQFTQDRDQEQCLVCLCPAEAGQEYFLWVCNFMRT